MEVLAAAAPTAAFGGRVVASPPASSRIRSPNRILSVLSSASSRMAWLSTSFFSPNAISSLGIVMDEFDGIKRGSKFLNPVSISSSKGKRSVVTMVVPFGRAIARERPPPDLASYLFKSRIVYLGMTFVPAVVELMLAEFLYLQYEDDKKPIYLYINSTGTGKDGDKLAHESEAFSVYDVMRYMKPPIFTLCVGNAWGEAALLLAAGSPGNRAALPSSSIMIKQPFGRFQGRTTDVDLARNEIKNTKEELVRLLAMHTGKSPEQIEADIGRPKYFTPEEAVEYGIIDKVIYYERSRQNLGVVSELKRANLI